MNNTKLACMCLLASAFVLSGFLLVQIDRNTAANEARADQVIAQPQFSLMTAQTQNNKESLFILDNAQAKLVVYNPNIGRRQVQPVTSIDLRQLFQ